MKKYVVVTECGRSSKCFRGVFEKRDDAEKLVLKLAENFNCGCCNVYGSDENPWYCAGVNILEVD